MDIGGGAVPIDNQPQVVQDDAKFAPQYPAMIGLAFLAHLVDAASRPHRMAQFDAVTVGHSQQSRRGQEVAGSAGLGFQPAEEAGAFGELGKEVAPCSSQGQAIVVFEPIIGAAAADPVSSTGQAVLDGVEDTDGDQLADREDSLGMLGGVTQGVVYLAVQ